MSKEEFLKIQTCVLKVNIHCDGCKQKVKKQLQKIEGVLTTHVDAEQGKVTVTGNVDPSILIKKLQKSGKYAEIWGSKGNSNKPKNKNMQLDNGKGQKDGKTQKGGKDQKGQQQPKQPQQIPQMNGFKDLKLPQFNFPFKDQKSVKFSLPEDYGDDYSGSDDFEDFEDEFYDDDDGMYDDGFDDHEELMKKIKGMNGLGGAGPLINDKKGGGDGKKGGGGNLQAQGIGGGGNNDGKNGNSGKKGGGGNNGGNQAQGGAQKNGAKNGGAQDTKNGNGNNKNANGSNNGSGGKKGGGGKNDLGGQPMGQPMHNMAQAFQGMGMGGEPRHMDHMGNIPVAQMPANLQAVQGMPAAAINPGGYFHGAGPEIVPGNPYYQQQLAMMMQQQRQNGNERFQPMMYARPPPLAYMHPPPPPYTNYFSDENANGCSVM